MSAASKTVVPTASAARKAAAPIKPRHFASARAFGAWLDKHHGRAPEMWVGFWKKGTGKPSIDWPQAVREALRVGWIDGIRKALGDEAYSAKRDDTQARRLAQLIADSAAGRRIGALTPQACKG